MKLKKCSRHFTILPSLAQGGQNFPLKTNVYTVYNKFSSLSTFFTRFNFHLLQWCTTFFGRGPQIDLLNPLGAKQVSRLKSGECLSKFMKIMCTVNHMEYHK